jgi:hypothetical protein
VTAQSSLNLVFPPDFPEGCPPSDAELADGEVFRLVVHNPVNETDFLSYAELGRCPDRDQCLRCGLSVFRTKEDSRRQSAHLRDMFPRKNFGNFIAKATLEHKHGKTKLTSGTQPTHTTWWSCHEPSERAGLFAVVEPV